MLKVLSLSSITKNRQASIKKEIMELLDINFGDEALFILDKNGIVNVRKFKEGVALGTGEKYISVSHILQHRFQTSIHASVIITGDVRHVVNVDIGDKILWILDNEGNIILRHNLILGGCSTSIFNKDVGALIIGLTSLNHHNNIISMPKEIIDILGAHEGDKVVLSLDKYDNIIVSKEIGKNLLQETVVSGSQYYNMYILDTVINILDNPDKILWFVDEEGNITIKNELLPDSCI